MVCTQRPRQHSLSCLSCGGCAWIPAEISATGIGSTDIRDINRPPDRYSCRHGCAERSSGRLELARAKQLFSHRFIYLSIICCSICRSSIRPHVDHRSRYSICMRIIILCILDTMYILYTLVALFVSHGTNTGPQHILHIQPSPQHPTTTITKVYIN